MRKTKANNYYFILQLKTYPAVSIIVFAVHDENWSVMVAFFDKT